VNIIDNINSPDDLKNLSELQLTQLCVEIREFLISSVSQTGGHLASNLGVVELSVAIHKSFNSPQDKILFDVGHQSYTHKILTGRKDQFNTLRKENGLSGFPTPLESIHDAFIGGHSSTSISAGLGISTAMQIKGEDNFVVVIIGDGSFTGGMVYEAINNAGRTNQKIIVILNHNEMSISKNVGACANYFSSLRNNPKYYKLKSNVQKGINRIPFFNKPIKNLASCSKKAMKKILLQSNFFEDLGFSYLGPVDGHSIYDLCYIFDLAKTKEGPVLIQVDTVKGKGYARAEDNPGAYHGVSNFDVELGNPDISSEKSFSTIAGKTIKKLADNNKRICAVTAAMKYGTGLQFFYMAHKERFFDVGIAEGHAITFCAGLASKGMIPVFAVYSSFLQRGFDQIIHDASIHKQHIVLAIDRAGIVGEDGKTHQGIFDVAFLSIIPDMKIYAPSNYFELEKMLEKAILSDEGVVAVRYPRGEESEMFLEKNYDYSDFTYFKANSKILAISYGREFSNVYKAQKILKQNDIEISSVKLNVITPISQELIGICLKYDKIYFFEEGIENGGVGQRLISCLVKNSYKGDFNLTAIDNNFVEQAPVNIALKNLKLDYISIIEEIKKGSLND
jgi:1-deoxy-D-xylulose-5-phosphate synthase